MTPVPFDASEANALCDEYGAIMGGRVEYRYFPATEQAGQEFGLRLYLPSGRNHGVRFKPWHEGGWILREYFEGAKDAWSDRLYEAA